MTKQERLNRILELVVAKGTLEVEAAAKALDVSVATIRRDFDELSQRNLLNRSHGAATAVGSSFALPLTYKVAKDNDVKHRIAEKAASMVSRHQVIGINGGTTTTEVARAIANNPEFAPGEDKDRPALTVVTNAVNIAAELTVRHQIKIVVTGGVARAQSYELTGPLAEKVLEEVAIDTTFLGIEAFDLRHGAMARFEDEARVNRAIAQRADQVVLVTTSSKFEQKAFAVIMAPDEIDIIITDEGITSKTKKELKAKGIEIIIA